MSFGDIIKDHRKNLILRIASRNALLRFAPAERGDRIDVCKIFPEQEEFLTGNSPADGICENGNDFMQRIFDGQVSARIDAGRNISRRLRNTKKIATGNRRTVGQWTLVLAWPFLHVPKERVGTSSPLIAPLFLWRIDVKVIDSGVAVFELMRDGDNSECEPNFILDQYLKAKGVLTFPNTDEILDVLQEPSSCNRKADAIAQWLNEVSHIENLQGFNAELRPYTKLLENSSITLVSVATLGNAHFKYHALFRDLESLEKKTGSETEDLGLLDSIYMPNGVSLSNESSPLAEQDRWLVEESDPSQETAVWHSREEKTIMQLKGPPGTGKSQTIVNIVADALQRNEKVAVVCHHTAALDVVRKRLEGIDRGDLLVRITSPKEDRLNVIKDAKAVTDESVLDDNERDAVCEQITENEKICDERIASFSPASNEPRKTRGHCVTKIDAIARETSFDANFEDNHPFCLTVSNWLQENSDEKYLLDEIKNIADRWESCDYPNHLWKGVSGEWGGRHPNLIAYFDDVIRNLGLNETRCEDLPSGDALVFAAHPMLFNYYSQITDVKRHNSINAFSKIVETTRRAFKYAGVHPCPPLWEFLCYQKQGERYTKYKQAIASIDDVCFIKRAIKNNPVIAVLAEKFGQQIKNWHQITEAAVCQSRLLELPDIIPFRNYSQAKDRLVEAIQKKKKSNAEHLMLNRDGRGVVAVNLKKSGYLNERGRAATTLRKIYHDPEDGGRIWTLFPVLLTNPDSISQIMPLKAGSIDLLVVDEASQMFTADAMPLLYRAKRAVISGDEHQMPPSNFFSNTGLSEDEEYEHEDSDLPPADVPYELLEAIENRANKVSQLEVHYRSRAAELIAFSNHAFYEGKLQAAPDNQKLPVFMKGTAILVEPVAGIFDNGKNAMESDWIIYVLRKIWTENKNCSVGVIVFNVKQRDLLLDKLLEASEQDENFCDLYENSKDLKDDGEDVGFFVRSVEHVQGDERDIIILGTTYSQGTSNFGPLSKKNFGRRRLNVAVTRAKVGMVVITSLDINKIANDAHAPGGDGESERWFLWKYMQYAKSVSGRKQEESINILQSLNPNYQEYPIGQEPENEFEKQVGKFLEKNNLHVTYQVGEGGFRIDLGVKNDRDDGTYLCGVECDGRTYHSGWRARENDIWRQKILEKKGWRIVRIWSDEWFSGDESRRSKFLEQVRG